MKRAIWSALVLCLIVPFTVAISPAFAATSYSFTNASATGRLGPTQAQINTAYSGTNLSGQVTVNTQGIQEWVVPVSGNYQVTAAGAAGANGQFNSQSRGIIIQSTVSLTQGTKYFILVGQKGLNGSGGASAGGGGTFLATGTTLLASSAVVVAGGGAGINSNTSYTQATTEGRSSTSGASSTDNRGAGGTNGAGGRGNSSGWGGGGGGFNGDGTDASNLADTKGFAFINGGMGGTGYTQGGFGGGAATHGNTGGGGGGGGYSGGGGSGQDSASTGGGGGGSFSVASYSTLGYNTGHGYLTITSLGPSLTTFAPREAITNSTSVTYDIAFSESVSGLAASDFSKSGTGSSTCTIGTPSGSGTSYTITLSGCTEGNLILTLAANAVANSSAENAPSSNTSAATVVIDRTAPTISSVSAPANGTYKPSDTPTFTVGFSESVTITGAPRLVLTVGPATEYAVFQSLTDSRTAIFRYTVATDLVEFDTDGIAVSTTLDLNSGTIRDLATNSLSNLTFSAPSLTSVFVAQPAAAPTIDSITATSGQLAIYFTPGAARGSTTTTYQYSSNGGAFTNRPTGTTASPLILTGLTNGTGYTIRLRATTNAGAGDSSTAVTETPTAISVIGDSTLTLTYGSSASTSAYSATGGTNTFTWSLGSSLTGITLGGTTVTASSSTPAGTYSQSVRATDGNSQVGTKALTITVNKASTFITIALPNSATNAALGGAVTITATVPRAGAVNFMLGGTTISGCGSSSAASTTAICSWTPGALGSVSLTATFTPTDSSNFESSTTTTLSITVVNGVSTVTLSLAGGTTTPPKGETINIIAAVDQAGRITFMIDGKRIPGCNNKVATVGNVTCSWKPAIQKETTITARLVPTNSVYNASSSSLRVQVVRRTGLR